MSGLVSAMRGFNFVFAGCMVALAVVQIINSDSAFKVMADALSVIYTMYVSFSPTHGAAFGKQVRTDNSSRLCACDLAFLRSSCSATSCGRRRWTPSSVTASASCTVRGVAACS